MRRGWRGSGHHDPAGLARRGCAQTRVSGIKKPPITQRLNIDSPTAQDGDAQFKRHAIRSVLG